MSKPLSRRARHLSTLGLALACFLGFDRFEAPPPELDDAELFVFAMSVQGETGEVYGSPVVVGQPDGRVEVRLLCEADPSVERMSLTLDPVPVLGHEDGKLRYSYVLNVPGALEQEAGTLELAPGREKRISLPTKDPRKRVTFALYAAPLESPDVESYLKARRVKLARTSS